MDIQELYVEVTKLTKLDKAYVFAHVSKLTEETGEFAQVVNKMYGRKKNPTNYNQEKLRQDLIEEAADTIQVIFSILSKCGIETLDEFLEALEKKNKKYNRFIENKKAIKNNKKRSIY